MVQGSSGTEIPESVKGTVEEVEGKDHRSSGLTSPTVTVYPDRNKLLRTFVFTRDIMAGKPFPPTSRTFADQGRDDPVSLAGVRGR